MRKTGIVAIRKTLLKKQDTTYLQCKGHRNYKLASQEERNMKILFAIIICILFSSCSNPIDHQSQNRFPDKTLASGNDEDYSFKLIIMGECGTVPTHTYVKKTFEYFVAHAEEDSLEQIQYSNFVIIK